MADFFPLPIDPTLRCRDRPPPRLPTRTEHTNAPIVPRAAGPPGWPPSQLRKTGWRRLAADGLAPDVTGRRTFLAGCALANRGRGIDGPSRRLSRRVPSLAAAGP